MTLAYFLLRGLILLTAFDRTAMVAYELHPMGTLPRVLLDGGSIPVEYFYDNAAGQLVTAYMALPFYALFGSTYLSLKLVPLLLGYGAMLAAWAFTKRHFGGRAAFFTALLFALGPGTLTKYSMLACGNHFENVFYTMLSLMAFWRAHATGCTRRGLAFAGFTAGLSIFVFLGAITPVGILFAVHLGLRGWKRTLADLASLAPSFALGLLPLVLVNVATGGRALSFLGAKFGGGGAGEGPDLGRVAGRAQAFVVEHLPVASTYPDWLGMPGELAEWLFLGAFAGAFFLALPSAAGAVRELVAGAFRARGAAPGPLPEGGLTRYLLVPLVLYLPLTALAFGLSDLRVGGYNPPIECGGYRYFNPHFLLAVLLVGIQAQRLVSSPGAPRRAAGFALGGAALLAGLFNLAEIDPVPPQTNLGARYEGHNVKQTARTFLGKVNELPTDEVVRLTEGLEPVYRERVYHGLGFYSAFSAAFSGDLTQIDLATILAPYPRERHADLARGVGTFLRFRQTAAGVLRPEARALLAAWQAAGHPQAERAIEGTATEWRVLIALVTPQHLAGNRALIADAPAEQRASTARGFGQSCGRLLTRGIVVEELGVRAEIEALPAGLRAAFFEGLGMGLADGEVEPEISAFTLQLVPEDLGPRVVDGYLRRVEEIWGDEPPAIALPEEWL